MVFSFWMRFTFLKRNMVSILTARSWPYSGEIDIYEGVGNGVQNTVSYHTSEGCSYGADLNQTNILNTAVGTDCNALENNGETCVPSDIALSDPDPTTSPVPL
ncbi:hypothetical protein Clacol_008366 [Clathrus columnatus]|uniref:Uncharacterized protein n=1 Tax=Clathrus columnatus TaxID=1419009 RepID=A0AAV5AN20_9AGAM|nr:hypothetical protein Clacol_008366 [Clathrus columnatus]